MSSISLFEPFVMGSHKLANRFAMNPMTRCRADAQAVPTAIMATYYGQRASAGLIITEGTAPSANGRGYARQPGLWTSAQVEGWKPVTAAVKAKGGTIFAQLMHTGRVSHKANMTAEGRVIAPSALALAGQMYTDSLGMQDYPVPEVMTADDIVIARAEFVSAAKNAIAAGFDGIELHGANGYLLEQFLSPHTNQRDDNYSGSVANRIRFVVEVAQAVATVIGGGNVGIRISPYGMASGMTPYPEVEETYLALSKALGDAGLLYLHVADHAAMGNPPIPTAFRKALHAAWPRTFFYGGSLDLAKGQAAVDASETDLVGLGRAFISNPDLVARLHNGTPLASADPATFYTSGDEGYTDYPTA